MKNKKANQVVSEIDFENQAKESFARIREDLPGYLDLMGYRGSFMIVMSRDSPDGKQMVQTIMHGNLNKIGNSLITACKQYPELLFILQHIVTKHS